MSSRAIAFLAILVLLAPAAISAQSGKLDRDGILARLSYQNTYAADWRTQEHSPHVCFALYEGGRYRISRVGKNGTENREGELSENELEQLTTMLKTLNSRGSGGIIHQGSESFTAEVARDDDKVHFLWINPDHKRPFPTNAAQLVEWLHNFKAPDSAPFTLRELSNEPICPPASQKPVQPVASAIPSGLNCGKR